MMQDWYAKLFRGVLFPAYEGGLRRRDTLRHLREYDANQWLDPAQIRTLQWNKLSRLLRHCEEQVPYYRRRWRELGIVARDIRSFDDFARLPLLTKHDIREHFEELKAESLRGNLLYKATGGSTGVPLRFGYTRESNDRRTAVMWRGYAWAGARMGEKTLYLWGGAVGDPSRAHLFKDRVFHAAFRRRILNSFAMREDNLASYADAIDAWRPRVIVAYVAPLVRLAQWLLDNQRRPPRIESIVTGAEALHDFQRELIERAFGCPVFNTYGCREFMLIASECEQRSGLHVNADHLVVEIAGREAASAPDSAGEIVITDLHNYGMPFVRYANGDLATPAHGGACACGRGLPLIARVDGRKLDAIRTPSGHVLPGEFFPHMLKDVPGLRQFQVVQRSLDSLDIALVRGAEFDASGEAYIRREIAKVLGDSLRVHINFVDTIPLTATGKLRVTVSELD